MNRRRQLHLDARGGLGLGAEGEPGLVVCLGGEHVPAAREVLRDRDVARVPAPDEEPRAAVLVVVDLADALLADEGRDRLAAVVDVVVGSSVVEVVRRTVDSVVTRDSEVEARSDDSVLVGAAAASAGAAPRL